MKTKKGQSESFVWISYADLMTTLTISFVLILLGLAAVSSESARKVRGVVKDISEARSALNQELQLIAKDFGPAGKYEQYGCSDVKFEFISDRNAIRATFKTGKGWFQEGEAEISEAGSKCLQIFSRLWLRRLYLQEKYRDRIEQLVIEGHTNSKATLKERTKQRRITDPFLGNLILSQRRAFNASDIILSNLQVERFAKGDPITSAWPAFVGWTQKHLTATGRSYSDLVYDKEGNEDYESSKRIEFKYLINHKYETYESIQ